MLDRFKSWWNRPDPRDRTIDYLLGEYYKFLALYYLSTCWSRVWKQSAKKWRTDAIRWKENYFRLYDRNTELLFTIEKRDEELVNLLARISFLNKDNATLQEQLKEFE